MMENILFYEKVQKHRAKMRMFFILLLYIIAKNEESSLFELYKRETSRER